VIDIEYNFHGQLSEIMDIGMWLESNMPNSPLPDPQRWSIGYSSDGRVGIRFNDEHDATLFCLRWGKW
jgi:hypothetical protein